MIENGQEMVKMDVTWQKIVENGHKMSWDGYEMPQNGSKMMENPAKLEWSTMEQGKMVQNATWQEENATKQGLVTGKW